MRPATAAALLCGLLATGCGVPLDEQPRPLDAGAAPFNVFEQSAPPEPRGDGRVALYFVRDDRVVLAPRAVERSNTIEEVLDLLLEGPTPEQIEAGTRSLLPSTFAVEDVEVGDNDVAVVTLADASAQTPTPPLGYAQIVATLTAPGRARAVRFRLDGVDLQVPRGDGSLTSDPLTRDDYAELLALSSAPPAAPAPAASPADGA